MKRDGGDLRGGRRWALFRVWDGRWVRLVGGELVVGTMVVERVIVGWGGGEGVGTYSD